MRNRRILATITASAVIAAILVAPSIAAGNPKNDCVAVDGDYIVVLNKGVSLANDIKNVNGRDVSPKYTYNSVFNGYSAFLTADQVCHLQKRPTVSLVEADGEVSIQDVQSPTPSWGLDRIDQPTVVSTTASNNQYNYASTGTGIEVFVVDTGINTKSTDFETRIKLPGFSAIVGGSIEDCNGHGTHVSGTIGGKIYGVAKQVKIVPVRVLGCNGSGTNSGVIAGLNWIGNNSTPGKSVVNMSLGSSASDAVDVAVNALISFPKNVVVVVAAGNSTKNACIYSPARVPGAITVAASDSTDNFASYSNYGDCIDIIAPGSNIKSDWIKGSTATKTISGTSMAAPHVAGAVARYLSSSTPSTHTSVATDLKDASTKGAVKNVRSDTFNYLLYIDPAK
jgi:subtilisin family serine protease